jgi:hypothetical protein
MQARRSRRSARAQMVAAWGQRRTELSPSRRGARSSRVAAVASPRRSSISNIGMRASLSS